MFIAKMVLFWLIIFVFGSGLCFGFGLGIFLVNRRYKKMREREQIIDIISKGKKVVLVDLGGGKGRDK